MAAGLRTIGVEKNHIKSHDFPRVQAGLADQQTACDVLWLDDGIGAVLDPGTIWHGIIIKVLAVIALAGGMKAAFAQAQAEDLPFADSSFESVILGWSL